jgi:phosphonate transport system permease protein
MKKLSIYPDSFHLVKGIGIAAGLAALFLFSLHWLQLDFAKFESRLGNVPKVVAGFMHLDLSLLPKILEQLLISLALGVSGLVLAILLSFFLAAMAAENTTFSSRLSAFLKGFTAVIRAIPSMVWILMVVASIGFGNTGALLGIVILMTGFLTKAFTEAFESDGRQRVEALRACGARWLNIVIQGVASSVLPSLLTWITIGLESSITISISLGVLGISGIGALLNKQIMKFYYPGISTVILVIFLTMITVEFFTIRLKRRLHAR